MKLNKITCTLPRKNKGPVLNRAWLQLDREIAKLVHSLIFSKTISFKVMKTIRYQLKTLPLKICSNAPSTK